MLEKYSYVIYGFLKKNLQLWTELSMPLIIGMTAMLAKDLPTIQQKEWLSDPTGKVIIENSQVKTYTEQWTVELSDGIVSIFPFIKSILKL